MSQPSFLRRITDRIAALFPASTVSRHTLRLIMYISAGVAVALILIVIFIPDPFYAIYHDNYFSATDYARGFFAAGRFSLGVVAAGTFACGIVSIGVFSIGIFSMGVFSIGLYSVGIFVIARYKDTIFKRHDDDTTGTK